MTPEPPQAQARMRRGLDTLRGMGTKPTLALPALVCVLVLLTGCGGGSSDQKANDAYASGVCTAIGSWLTEAKSLSTIPSGITQIKKDSLDAKLKLFETATRTFVSQIKAVPAPKTSEGKTAKQGIDQLTMSARGASAAVQTAVSSVPANASITQMMSALVTVLPEFQTLKDTTRSELTALRSGGGSLADAFKSERACQQLG
jgi:hypothetical protein